MITQLEIVGLAPKHAIAPPKAFAPFGRVGVIGGVVALKIATPFVMVKPSRIDVEVSPV